MKQLITLPKQSIWADSWLKPIWKYFWNIFHPLDMFKNELQKTAIFGTFCAIFNCLSSDDDQFTKLGSKKSWSNISQTPKKWTLNLSQVPRKIHLIRGFWKVRKVSWYVKMEKCPWKLTCILVIWFPSYFAKSLARWIQIWERSLFCIKKVWGCDWDTCPKVSISRNQVGDM